MENNAMVIHDPNVSLGLQKVADGLFKSGMFPNARNAFGAYAIVQYGHELGIPPMMALKNINIISGQLACNAQLMLSMAMSRGVTYKVITETDKGATIEFRRGDITYTATFNEADAQAAGLTGKDNWRKYARDMYFWRAAAKGIRRIAPDAVLGLYTKDEISNGEIVDLTPKEPIISKDETIIDAAPQVTPQRYDDVPEHLGQPEPTPAPPEEVPPQGNLASQDAKPALISEAQRKRFYAIAKASGKSDGEIKSFLREHIGSESTGDIQRGVYEYLCNEVGNGAAA